MNERANKSAATPGYLVTGYPGSIGRRLVEHISHMEPEARIFALVLSKQKESAEHHRQRLGSDRVVLLEGDVVDMHLGLSGEEYEQVCAEVTEIFHLAAISYLSVPKETAWQVNVDGTRNVLELARDCAHLQRLAHFSTCHVAGERLGVIAEDELDLGQAFHNVYEETKFHAEKLVQRASPSLPISIFRPSSVVGDSQTGEIDRFDGPYSLGLLLVTSPLVMPLPLPGDGIAPLNVVPVDFVVQAAFALARDPRGVGRTFHLVDPNPMGSRRVYEMIAEKANRKLPRFNIPARAADVMLRLPLLEKLARPQRAAITYANQLALYNCQNTLELLDGTGIRCPPLSSYLDKLIDYVKEFYRQRQERLAGDEDPLDHPFEGDGEENTAGK